jgi:hypothetical protein
LKINFNTNNPYYNTPQTSWFTGPWTNKTILPNVGDRRMIIEPKYNFRPQNMSQDLYNNPAYYWVLWLRNIDIIKSPILDFTTGKTIIVPSPEYVRELFG